MLTHRTEYQISVNGSGWGAYVNSVWTADAFTVLANEEECGSYARSIGPLTTGSYNIRLRVTSLPETALSTVLYTETGVFLVNNTTLSYATTSQPVQSSIANGSLKLTAAGVEYQITQTNVAAASLSITGAAVTSQPTQTIYANGPLPLVGTVITDNKVQTESITGVVVIYGTVDQSQKTQTEIVSGTVATVTPSVSITSGTALQVVLDWADYAANTTFDVYRHTSSFTPPGTGTKVGNALTVSTFTELTTAATYYYRVIAVSASGSSVPSNQISVTTAAAGDTTAPSVTAFTLGTVSGLTVPVSSLTATDVVGVTGYIITENSTVPTADGSNLSTTTADSTHAKSSMTAWIGTAPTSYTTAEAGTKTLYAWAKDAAGNVSTGAEVTGNVFAGSLTVSDNFNSYSGTGMIHTIAPSKWGAVGAVANESMTFDNTNKQIYGGTIVHGARWVADAITNDQWSECRLSSIEVSTFYNAGPACRIQTGGDNGKGLYNASFRLYQGEPGYTEDSYGYQITFFINGTSDSDVVTGWDYATTGEMDKVLRLVVRTITANYTTGAAYSVGEIVRVGSGATIRRCTTAIASAPATINAAHWVTISNGGYTGGNANTYCALYTAVTHASDLSSYTLRLEMANNRGCDSGQIGVYSNNEPATRIDDFYGGDYP